ncbi:MAG: hypothetical protein KUG68_01800 [Flavobacteriaceae bacterium]|nr:hypothetical protein [Flavobacteriaceae bacterium]
MSKNPFQSIIDQLLASKTPQEEVDAAKSISKVYHQILNKFVLDSAFKNTDPTNVDGGIALSSQHALDCLEDPFRTTRFLKAVHHAILDCFDLFPSEKINILYAGCGPAAPLILPLLGLFKPSQISITLLDLNETSLSSVSILIHKFGFQDYFRDAVMADATTYNFPDEIPLHLVVTETMDKALTKEPQVRITQNLASQIIPKGILIPEEIKIYTEHSFYSNEPYFGIYKDVFNLGKPIETIDTQILFSIDKNIKSKPQFSFESNWIQVPENFKEYPDISIYAKIFIYKNYILSKGESLISNPFGLYNLYNIKSNAYKLIHSTEGIPSWEFIEKN